MSIATKIVDFFKRKDKASIGGGDKAIQKQVAIGKMTARERINALLDDNSFLENDLFVEHQAKDFDMDKKQLPADGVITGTGTISVTRSVFLHRILLLQAVRLDNACKKNYQDYGSCN